MKRPPVKTVNTEESSEDEAYVKQKLFVRRLYELSEKHDRKPVTSKNINPSTSFGSHLTARSPPPEIIRQSSSEQSREFIEPHPVFTDLEPISLQKQSETEIPSEREDFEPIPFGCISGLEIRKILSAFWRCTNGVFREGGKDETENNIKLNVPSNIAVSCAASCSSCINLDHDVDSTTVKETNKFEKQSNDNLKFESQMENDELDQLVEEFNATTNEQTTGEETSIIESYSNNIWVVSCRS